jgi:hypothetical protein
MPETIAPTALEERPATAAPPADASLLTLDTGADTIQKPQHRPAAIPKCPYLAGRPPHGTYHMWPSGVNVCHARSVGDEPFGHVSKDTQDSRCFCAAEVFEQCPDFQSARSRNISLPVFGGSHPATAVPGRQAEPERRHRRERHKRQRRSRAQKWWDKNRGALFVSACWLVLAAVAFWLVWRSM